jgi:LuxR family transcriptional regulator, maltose regulon positive regulatory protein
VDAPRDSRFAVPMLPPCHIARPRLLAALDQAADVPLVLVTAAPGAGKTVLLTDWALRQQRVGWLRLTPGDEGPRRFWRLFTAALTGGQGTGPPSVAASRANALDVLCSLVSGLPGAPARLTVVIDDAQVLTDPAVLDLFDKLICAAHPLLRLVLCGRGDPGLPLHRYRLAGQVREIGDGDLAMNPSEAGGLLAAHKVRLPAEDLGVLLARTEGWVAGIRLFAMRMQDAADPAGCVPELAFNHGSAGEYLVAEVLDPQPEPLRRLLLQTSFLDEVTGPLADTITGMHGCAEMLAGLARSNSFVIATDCVGTRFRYHQLFREVLRHLLRVQAGPELPELMMRAAARLERDGDLAQALRWAVAAGDKRHAVALLTRGGLADAFAHRRRLAPAGLTDLLTSAGGLSGCPEAAFAVRVLSAETATAQTAAAELGRVPEQRTVTGADLVLRVTADLSTLILAMRAGDVDVLDAAADGLAANPRLSEWPGLRAAILLSRASTHFWHGKHRDVDALLNQALAAAQADQSHVIELEAYAMMAYADSYWARPRHADDAMLRARAILGKHPRLNPPPALELAGAIRALTAADLRTAHRSLRDTRLPDAVGPDPGLARALVLGHAGLLLSAGRAHRAGELLRAAADGPALPLLDAHRDMILASIETDLGRPQAAIRLLRPHHDGGFAVLVAVPQARAYLAMRDYRSAQNCTRRVLAAASGQVSPRVLADAMLCEAQIVLAAGDHGRALAMIAGALDVADGEIVLPFLQVTDEFAALLSHHRDIAARWPVPPDADTRYTIADCQPPGTGTGPDTLTPREYAVMRFLATSMTSAEIAAELCVSVNTVKTHLAAIYRKLGTRKRREAVVRARELELI